MVEILSQSYFKKCTLAMSILNSKERQLHIWNELHAKHVSEFSYCLPHRCQFLVYIWRACVHSTTNPYMTAVHAVWYLHSTCQLKDMGQCMLSMEPLVQTSGKEKLCLWNTKHLVGSSRVKVTRRSTMVPSGWPWPKDMYRPKVACKVKRSWTQEVQ